MKPKKEILSAPPKGFWKRLKWETIDCWQDWFWMFAVLCVLVTSILMYVAEFYFYSEVYEAAKKINGH